VEPPENLARLDLLEELVFREHQVQLGVREEPEPRVKLVLLVPRELQVKLDQLVGLEQPEIWAPLVQQEVQVELEEPELLVPLVRLDLQVQLVI